MLAASLLASCNVIPAMLQTPSPEPTALPRIRTPMRTELLTALAVLERDLRWEWAYWLSLPIPIGVMAVLLVL